MIWRLLGAIAWRWWAWRYRPVRGRLSAVPDFREVASDRGNPWLAQVSRLDPRDGPECKP